MLRVSSQRYPCSTARRLLGQCQRWNRRAAHVQEVLERLCCVACRLAMREQFAAQVHSSIVGAGVAVGGPISPRLRAMIESETSACGQCRVVASRDCDTAQGV